MAFRHLREPFQHARRSGVRPRLGRTPLLFLAVAGAAAAAGLQVSQATSAGAPPVRTDQAAVVNAPPSAAGVAQASPAQARPAQASPAKVTPAQATPAQATPAQATPTQATPAKAEQKAEKKVPARIELYYQYGVQTTGWYCGPAATRMALSARGIYASQDQLAGRLGTTVNGTNSSADVVRVLNAMTRTSHYHTTSMPSEVSKAQVERLRADVVRSISQGFPVVIAVGGTGTDLNGNSYSYPGGHYITLVGYRDNGAQVKVADSANPNTASYWISTGNLATWAGTRGYAS
jgi:hypothetical protein